MANEFKRMQKLAGLITESQLNENKSKLYAMLADVADEFGKDSDFYSDLESAIVGWSDRNGELTPKGKLAIKNLLSNWDLLDDYGHFLDENIEEGFKVIKGPAPYDDQIEISADSGDYSGFIEDDGTISFSVVFDDIEDIENEFGLEGITEENWKDVLGSDHAFVKIIDSIGGKVEALDDYVQITVDADKLLNSNIKEASEKSDWTVGEEIIGGKKHYFLYNQKTGKRKGMYKSKEEAEQNINEGDTDYDRAKDAKRLGKKGEKNIYGAGVKKGEEIEKKKMKMSELKAAIKALAEGEEDLNINDDESLYDPVYEASEFDMNKAARIKEFIIALNKLVDEYHAELYLNDDLFSAISMVIKAAKEEAMNSKLSEAKKDEEVEDIKDVDVTVGDEETMADVTTAEVDPNVKSVQDALTQAQVAAEKLGDDKLTDQIGNTITFFTRTHIVDKPTMAAESNIKERINKLMKSL